MEVKMKITLYTHIGDYGQYVDRMELSAEENEGSLEHAEAEIEGHYCDLSGKTTSGGIKTVLLEEKKASIEFDPFLYRYDFVLRLRDGSRVKTITKKDADEVAVEGLEDFEPIEENGIRYRLYTPEGNGVRPLVLFLHGGGESGEDNLLQMTGTIGALELAKRFPEMYVMAPQAPGGTLSMEENLEQMKKRGNPFAVEMGMTPFALKGERGWNRDYLGKVIDVIRRMIADGKADARRIYVIGMSMGGGGTIQAVTTAPDLFAAAAPICPSMNGESYAQLLHWPDVPVWISTAYMDHQHGRHAYLLNAVNKLLGEGRSISDLRYTIYLPEELEAYGIGTTPDLTMRELDAENHNSWILTLHNEKGILSWLFSHVKSEKKEV